MYSSVMEMVRDLSGDSAFADRLENRIAGKAVVKNLTILRVRKGLTQKDVAEKMGCS